VVRVIDAAETGYRTGKGVRIGAGIRDFEPTAAAGQDIDNAVADLDKAAVHHAPLSICNRLLIPLANSVPEIVTVPLPSIAVPPLNISSVACAATEVTPLRVCPDTLGRITKFSKHEPN
jgi:hypothetical protein